MANTLLAELTISLPFRIDSLGRVGITASQDKVWADRVRSVIGTALGQRVYRPSFGNNATLGIFNTEEYVLNTIEEDIARSFASFLPLLVVQSIEVEVDADTDTITVEVSYESPSGSEYAVRLGIATINGDSSISEEFSWQNQ